MCIRDSPAADSGVDALGRHGFGRGDKRHIRADGGADGFNALAKFNVLIRQFKIFPSYRLSLIHISRRVARIDGVDVHLVKIEIGDNLRNGQRLSLIHIFYLRLPQPNRENLNRKDEIVLKAFSVFLFAVLLSSLLCVGAAAGGGDISPALDILRSELTLTKTGVVGSEVTFTASDFESLYGSEVSFITVSSLPDEQAGRLSLNGVDVIEGQTIAAASLSLSLIHIYTIDVYRGDARVQRRIVPFGTYVTLFPQLIAGPIVRYSDVDEQLTYRKETVRCV